MGHQPRAAGFHVRAHREPYTITAGSLVAPKEEFGVGPEHGK